MIERAGSEGERKLPASAAERFKKLDGLTDPSSGVFLDDIDGNTRPGQLIWDIGADEYFPTGGNRGYITG